LGRKLANNDKRVSRNHFVVRVVNDNGGYKLELKLLGRNPLFVWKEGQPVALNTGDVHYLTNGEIFALLHCWQHRFEVKLDTKNQKRKREEEEEKVDKEESDKKRHKINLVTERPKVIDLSDDTHEESRETISLMSDKKEKKETKSPEKKTAKDPKRTPEKTTAKDPKRTPEKTTAKDPKRTPEKTTANDPKRTPEKTTANDPKRSPEKTPRSKTNVQVIEIDNDEPGNGTFILSLTENMDSSVTKKCSLCLEDVRGDYFLMLSCGDQFCRECLSQFFETMINSKSFPILCPNLPCRKEIPDHDFRNILSKELLSKYEQFTLGLVLEKNPNDFSHCLTPDCSFAFFRGPDDPIQFRCPVCKKSYCLECKIPFHNGQTCEDFQKKNYYSLPIFHIYIPTQKCHLK